MSARPSLALSACLMAALVGGQPLGTLPPPGLYARLVEPAEYPAYRRRGFVVPSWSTFGNRTQMVGGRYVPFTAKLDKAWLEECPADDGTMTDRPWLVGRVFRPDIGILRTKEPGFSDALRRMSQAGMYLFNVGGYGPGSPVKGSFGQCLVTEEQNRALVGLLGDHWLGFDLGEQDGRYHNAFASYQLPSPRDRVGQHRALRDWCDRVIDDQAGRLTLLSTLWGWHYPVQDGAMGLIGAECQNKFGVTNPQVQYAFLRGAGKQYGVLWYGDVSIFSTFGLTRWSLDGQGELVVHPGGGSANLMRRMFLSEWLWNCAILGFEGATVAQGADRAALLSPIGRVQVSAQRLVASGFSPGVMQTPVALLGDYFSGWMPARTNCTEFRSFNSLPYGPGNHLTDNLLAMLYPGYEDCGWYMDERGAMAPTPYGDIADCLLGDAQAQVLARYSLVLASGLEHDAAGLRDRLDSYLASGGTVMVTGDDASRLWPEYCRQTVASVPADAEVRWAADGRVDREPWAFDLHELALPAGAVILATCQGRPAVARLPHRGGSLLLVASATGMNQTALPCKRGGHPMWGGENTGLERPYRLLAHVRRAYDAALASQKLFTAGEGLSLTSCRRPDGTFVVGISNPWLVSLPFSLVSHIGDLASVTEVDLGPSIRDLPGYWPHRWSRFILEPTQHRDDLGELTGDPRSDANHLGGGDMRLFEVRLKACTARLRPDLKLPAPPQGRRLLVPDLMSLRERLLAWPRFADCFDGVALPGQALLDADPSWLGQQAAWFRRHGVKMLAMTSGLDRAALSTVAQRLAVVCPGGQLETDSAPVHLLRAGTVPDRGLAGIQVLEGDWRDWDGLYRDVRAAWLDDKPGRISGPGPAAVRPTGTASRMRRLVALHGLADPAVAVAERPGLLDRFGGVMLDAGWLEARSREAVGRDQAWLAARGLAVVIDFTRSVNRFPDVTFASGVPHRYDASVASCDAVLAKMVLLGARDAVICSHASAENGDDWADQRRGIERFLDSAASLGIAVHWRASAQRPPGKLADHAALVADLRRSHPNLRMAACTVEEPDADRLIRALEPAGQPELWLLAAPDSSGDRTGTRFMPLTTMPAPTLSRLGQAARDSTTVFDADYLSWQEVLADTDQWQRQTGNQTR